MSALGAELAELTIWRWDLDGRAGGDIFHDLGGDGPVLHSEARWLMIEVTTGVNPNLTGDPWASVWPTLDEALAHWAGDNEPFGGEYNPANPIEWRIAELIDLSNGMILDVSAVTLPPQQERGTDD